MYLEIISTFQLIVSTCILLYLGSLCHEEELKPIDEKIRRSMYS